MLTTSEIEMTMKAVRRSAEKPPEELLRLVEAVEQSLECKECVVGILSEMCEESSSEMAIVKRCYTMIAFGIAAGTMLRAPSVVAGVGRA